MQITLTIGGPRIVEEPFAYYQGEARSDFHWDDGRLYACIEGQMYSDQGYWFDHFVLPEGGEVKIDKSCTSTRATPSTQKSSLQAARKAL